MFVATSASERLGQAILKKSPVGKSRQSVVVGQVLDAVFGYPAVRDVAKIPDSAPIAAIGIDERGGVSVEDSPILQPDLIAAFLVPVAVEILDSFGERFRGLDLVSHVLEYDKVVLCTEHLLRHLEVEPELLIC